MSRVVFEGRVSAEAILSCNRRSVHRLLLSPHSDLKRLERLIELALGKEVLVQIVRTELLAQLAGDTAHGGVIALCSEREYQPVEEMLAWVEAQREPALIFVLAGFEDAYNMGYALRAAEAFGAGWVLCDRKEWLKDEPTVLRSSAGAFERLPISAPESLRPALQGLKGRGVRLLAALEGGTMGLYDTDLRSPVAWMVGGEKRGLSQYLREMADFSVRIPTRPNAPPLPASHAVAILAAETFRQRLKR
ncbi:MAG: RNA methyltransferase [Armatimonadota bacterium]|nr:RNA methyltransferase [bacterium]MDW8321436.1 RNA methyltransferase [Armatimonadota bacterium]